MKVEVCKAEIEQHTVQAGAIGIAGQLGIIDTTIDCALCKIHLAFRSGVPGYSTVNDSDRRISDVVQRCPMLLSLGFSAGEIPTVNLPKIKVT